MAKGRGSAVLAAALLFCLVLVHQTQVARATTYAVGGTNGWNYNVVGWPNGKNFSTRDTLVFKYDPNKHNVLAVNKEAYDNCSTKKPLKTYKSGNDSISLVHGQQYYICGMEDHCLKQGMKIAIKATAA